MTIEKRKNFIINIIYFALIITIVYIVIKYVLGLVMPFIIGLIVALLLRPVINFASEKLHVHTKAVALNPAVLWRGGLFYVLDRRRGYQ